MIMFYFVLAIARLDTFAGADWSGYNLGFFHSRWLQHRCDEHSSTCKAILISHMTINCGIMQARHQG